MLRSGVIALCILLSACSATGPTYSSLDSSPRRLAAQNVELVVYRPSSFALMARAPDVEINGVNTCELSNGSFFTREIELRSVAITASLWDMPGTSRLSFKPQAGKRYFVRVSTDGGKLTAGVIGGYIGLAIAEGASSRGGPFVIDLLDEQAALPELQPLKMSTACRQ